eukprot:195908_1
MSTRNTDPDHPHHTAITSHGNAAESYDLRHPSRCKWLSSTCVIDLMLSFRFLCEFWIALSLRLFGTHITRTHKHKPSDFSAKSMFVALFTSSANVRNNHCIHKSIVLMLLIASVAIRQSNAQNSIFQCDSSDQCSGDMYCIDGADCHISCSDYACQNGVVHPPNTGNLTLNCNRPYSCRSMTITGPQNGNLFLNCPSGKYCPDWALTCPIFGDCNVDLGWNTAVDARSMISGSLYVTGDRDSTVQCPGNNLDCIVNPSDHNSYSTSYYTKNDSVLNITASSLLNVDVHCVLNADCSIIVTQPVADAFAHFRLFSMDGMDGMTFIWQDVTVLSECFNFDNPAQLWCGSQHKKGCSIEYSQHKKGCSIEYSQQIWQCTNGMYASELCTNNAILAGYHSSRIVCDKVGECDYDMYCIDGEDCIITCSAAQSCENGVIHPPNIGKDRKS